VNALSWILVGGAIAAAGLAIYAGNNLLFAVPAGAVAIAMVAVVGAAQLRGRTSALLPARSGMARAPVTSRIESDSLLRLRRSFSSGEIGRGSILATVRALERDMSPGGRTALSLEAEREILDLSADKFREWVDERLRKIEAVT
jgi:hypothetical protein